MSTFKEIAGRNIRSYTTNPDNPLEGQMWYNQTDLALKGVVATAAWSAGGNLNTGRTLGGGAGDKNSGLVAGGYATTAKTAATEEYNGTTLVKTKKYGNC